MTSRRGEDNGGHVRRGGTPHCPPVRSCHPRTLRTVTIRLVGGAPNRMGARAVCTYMLRRFTCGIIHTRQTPISTRRAGHSTRPQSAEKACSFSCRWPVPLAVKVLVRRTTVPKTHGATNCWIILAKNDKLCILLMVLPKGMCCCMKHWPRPKIERRSEGCFHYFTG